MGDGSASVFLVHCMCVSSEMLSLAGVLSACSTCHGSSTPTCFVLSAHSDPLILRVDFAVMRLERDARCRPAAALREMMCDCVSYAACSSSCDVADVSGDLLPWMFCKRNVV